MNDELKMVVNAIIEEISKTEERIYKKIDERFDQADRRFNKIEFCLESMQHDINACKLEFRKNELYRL